MQVTCAAHDLRVELVLGHGIRSNPNLGQCAHDGAPATKSPPRKLFSLSIRKVRKESLIKKRESPRISATLKCDSGKSAPHPGRTSPSPRRPRCVPEVVTSKACLHDTAHLDRRDREYCPRITWPLWVRPPVCSCAAHAAWPSLHIPPLTCPMGPHAAPSWPARPPYTLGWSSRAAHILSASPAFAWISATSAYGSLRL